MTTIKTIKEDLKRRIEGYKPWKDQDCKPLWAMNYEQLAYQSDLCLLAAIEALEDSDEGSHAFNKAEAGLHKITTTWEENR